MKPVKVVRGDGPVVLGLPHTGTFVPDDIASRLTQRGSELADTDWHIERLYDGLLADVTTVRATFHRYVIDANRDPSGGSLYPGQNTTGLVPFTDFDGQPLWTDPPDDSEVEERRQSYHEPYHAALAGELNRVHDDHGVAILYDCHSIRSHIPFLFEGTLPDFNIGTNEGTTCGQQIEAAVVDICASARGFTHVTNGRFKGGWTTRYYGCPENGFHAIQMELAQSTYLTDECAPWAFDQTKAACLCVHLSHILKSIADLAPTPGSTS